MPALVGGVNRTIVTAYEPKTYAGLSNRVDIFDDDGGRIAYIRPPMWAYSFARQVAKATPDRIGFYLEQVGQQWVFGVDVLDNDWSSDLITYRRHELPYWATMDYQQDLRNGTEARL